jgi:hypothetical protein
MKNCALWIVSFSVAAWTGCVHRTETPSIPPVQTLETLREGLSSPSALAIDTPETYFVVSADAEGKSRVNRFHRDKTEALFSGLVRPGAMTYDFRGGRLFVTDGGEVKIFHLGMFGFSRQKKLSDPPAVVAIPGAEEIGSITFSLMNNRLYLADTKAGRIWSLDSKKERVEEILGPEGFEAFGAGRPAQILVSTDGKRIYAVLSKAASETVPVESTLATLNLKTRKLETVRAFPGVAFGGLDVYRSHFILADRATGEIYTVSMRDRKVEKLAAPLDWKGPATQFGMDLNWALFLVPEEGGQKGKLVRHTLAVKE